MRARRCIPGGDIRLFGRSVARKRKASFGLTQIPDIPALPRSFVVGAEVACFADWDQPVSRQLDDGWMTGGRS
jgi:hypothetical protein